MMNKEKTIEEAVRVNEEIGIGKIPPQAFISVNFNTKQEWKNTYDLKVRFYLRLISLILPGFLRINIKNKKNNGYK